MAGLPSDPIPRYCTVAVTVHDFHMVPYSPAHDRQALELLDFYNM